MPRRSPSQFRSSSPRRGFLWATASINPTSIAQNAQVALDLLPNVDRGLLARSTITRVVGVWAARGVTNDLEGAAGISMYLIQEDALTAGAIPELEQDLVSFLWYDTIYTYHGNVLDSGPNQYTQHVIDSKAQRKMTSEEMRFALGYENISLNNTNMVIAFSLRILIRVP